MRGNHRRPAQFKRRRRSIPACAGEPGAGGARRRRRRVYPRVCGGTMLDGGHSFVDRGLSPRVRGNRVEAQAAQDVVGSIPACAGEPFSLSKKLIIRRVYPRVCGGTSLFLRSRIRPVGLSPRVRGNPHSAPAAASPSRSIPACAGEPPSPTTRPPRLQVYPRVCGGTPTCFPYTAPAPGLSPRVRGNPRPHVQPLAAAGSIPACAGEPRNPA